MIMKENKIGILLFISFYLLANYIKNENNIILFHSCLIILILEIIYVTETEFLKEFLEAFTFESSHKFTNGTLLDCI